MIYLLEKRKTVGAFKTIAASSNFKDVYLQFDKLVRKLTGGYSVGSSCEILNSKKKKDQDILKYFKIGGAHNNIILRIRKIEEVL